MNICLDYDDTYTKDPEGWNQFVEAFKKKGHQFYCITQRGKDTKDKQLENSIGQYMDIIYTAGSCKRKAAGRRNILIQVWIDDQPESIPCNSGKMQARY